MQHATCHPETHNCIQHAHPVLRAHHGPRVLKMCLGYEIDMAYMGHTLVRANRELGWRPPATCSLCGWDIAWHVNAWVSMDISTRYMQLVSTCPTGGDARWCRRQSQQCASLTLLLAAGFRFAYLSGSIGMLYALCKYATLLWQSMFMHLCTLSSTPQPLR